jgi:hypothetical protein
VPRLPCLVRGALPSTSSGGGGMSDADTGLPGGPIHHDNWMGDRQKAVSELESPEPEVLFVCGGGRNRDHVLPHFTKIFNLRIDDDTMRRRLQERTADDWDLGPEAIELMLELNRSDDKPAGAIDVDATQPLNQVVDELLRLANYPSARRRWARRSQLDADVGRVRDCHSRIGGWAIAVGERGKSPDMRRLATVGALAPRMSKREIVRCLKRYVARDVYRCLVPVGELAVAA